MAFTKAEFRIAIEKIYALLNEVANISPENPMDIQRVAIASFAMSKVVSPCKSLLLDVILGDNTQGLCLNDIDFNEKVEEIEQVIVTIKEKLSLCEPETPQRFY